MRSILGRGLSKKSDELLEMIQKIMAGKSIKELPQEKNQYEEEIKEAETFLKSSLTSNVGFWEIIAHPISYEPNLLQNSVAAGKAVEESVVHLRGWDFPHVDNHGHMSNFGKGKQSFTISDTVHVQEAWRIYKSGLFVWKDYFREDLRGFEEGGNKVLFFVSAIYFLTETMLFFKRLYAEKLQVDTINIKISLHGCKDRKLGEGQPGLLNWDYISNEENITIDKEIATVDLQASPETVARTFIKEIFMQFNWNDPAESMLQDWQKKLIEKDGL